MKSLSSGDHFSYVVTPRESGLRLDVFLLARLRLDYPERVFFRSEVIFCLREGVVLVSGKKAKPSSAVSLDDVVEGEWRERVRETHSQGFFSGKEPKIIFENKHFRVLEKPAGLQIHPSAKQEPDTLIAWLQERFPRESALLGDAHRFGIVHRLDKETSGLLLVARTSDAWDSLKRLFRDRKIEKTYYALVFGHFSSRQGSIEGDIIAVEHSLRRRMASLRDSDKKRTARTDYEVIKRFQDFDLVKASPKTGRTHQIRVHFLSAGHPIVGDKLYGHRLSRGLVNQKKPIERHFLHAAELHFSCFDEEYRFESPLPMDCTSYMQKLDEIKE